MKSLRLNRRMDDFRRALINPPYPLRHRPRIGHEMIGLARGRLVPALQPSYEHGKESPLAQAERFPAGVALIVPHPAHGGVAVTDVYGMGRGAHSLGISRRTGNDQVVIGEIQRADRERIKKKVEPVVVLNAGQPLHPRSLDGNVPQSRRHATGQGHGGEKCRPREQAVQFFRNLLGPAELGKIIVYNGNSHFILHQGFRF